MIKVAAYTNGGIEVASCRLRSFYLFKKAGKFGLKVLRNLSFTESLSCHCLHLQKIYTPQFIVQALLFRILRKKVIFDIDDHPSLFKHKLGFFLLSFISSHITVDTIFRKKYLSQYIPSRKIKVIQDVIDINSDYEKNFLKRKLSNSGGMLWIGHRDTLPSIEPFFNFLKGKERKMFVSTSLLKDDVLINRYPDINFIDWKIDISFDPDINICFMILNHDKTVDSNAVYKSENKMVTAIASGLIPIVSASPAYEELAIKLDANQIIFNEIKQINRLIDNLEVSWMEDFISKSQEYILENYSNTVLLRHFKSLFF